MNKRKIATIITTIVLAVAFTFGTIAAPASETGSAFVQTTQAAEEVGYNYAAHVTVVFHGNGATKNTFANQTYFAVKKGQQFVGTIAKTGCTFAGWNTMPDGTGVSYAKNNVVSTSWIELNTGKTIDLYAQWTKNTYYVAFNANGGTGNMPTQTFTYGVKQNLAANTFKNPGYKFTGWNTKADGTGHAYSHQQAISKLTKKANKVITLYAQWKPNTYYVSFNPRGGSGYMYQETFTYGVSKQLTTNTFKKKGYSFLKWNTKKKGTGTSYKDAQTVSNLTTKNGKVITLYAQWKENYYYVAFKANGGTGTMSKETFKYNTSKKLLKNKFKKTGYTFIGWSTKKDGSGKFYTNREAVKKLTATSKKTIVLYAQWVPNVYYISFNANGGKGKMDTQAFIYTVVDHLNKNTFTKAGYDFAGWTTAKGTYFNDGAKIYKLNSKAGKIIKLYAKWTPIRYTVVFDANGGTGTMKTEAFAYDKLKQLIANKFQNEGYVFTGWNTKADGSGTQYIDGAYVQNLTKTSGAVVTLYAQWVAIPE